MHHRLVEHRQQRRQFAAWVQHETAAVEHLIVLPAHHVEIDQRQPRLDHAGHHVGQPPVELVAVVGRAVGHQKEARPGLGQGFTDIRVPGILADRRADTQRSDAVRAVDRTRGKQALFVEHGFVGQVMLQDRGLHPATRQDEIRVVELLGKGIGAADADRRAIGAFLRKLIHQAHRMKGEAGLHHQILRLVAGDEHLGQRQHVGAGRLGGGPCRAHHVGIRVQRADGRVKLCKCQAKSVGHRHLRIGICLSRVLREGKPIDGENRCQPRAPPLGSGRIRWGGHSRG